MSEKTHSIETYQKDGRWFYRLRSTGYRLPPPSRDNIIIKTGSGHKEEGYKTQQEAESIGKAAMYDYLTRMGE